jgi:uncharacterized protein YbjT (DUF2867 family)
MRIAIIGAGSIGGTLARNLTALGHDVTIANSRPETLARLAAETGATPVALPDVATGADVVILALPVGAAPALTGAHLLGTVGGLDDLWRQQPGTPVYTATSRSAPPGRPSTGPARSRRGPGAGGSRGAPDCGPWRCLRARSARAVEIAVVLGPARRCRRAGG